MRIDLLVLAALASSALAALVDSARRAVRSDVEDLTGGWISSPPLIRATLEQLERERAGMDGHGPRLLLAIAGSAAVCASGLLATAWCAELAVVLLAVALGLAAPGIWWARDARRDAVELSDRIVALRARLGEPDSRSRPLADGSRWG